MHYLKNPKKCPACGEKAGAKILWGMPAMDEEMEDALSRGVLTLGGCVVGPEDPDNECTACGHRWGGNQDMVIGNMQTVYYAVNEFEITREHSKESPCREVYCQKFEGICDKNWDELESTDDANKRYCKSCRKKVWLITDYAKLLELRNSKRNICVAYFDDSL